MTAEQAGKKGPEGDAARAGMSRSALSRTGIASIQDPLIAFSRPLGSDRMSVGVGGDGDWEEEDAVDVADRDGRRMLLEDGQVRCTWVQGLFCHISRPLLPQK